MLINFDARKLENQTNKSENSIARGFKKKIYSINPIQTIKIEPLKSCNCYVKLFKSLTETVVKINCVCQFLIIIISTL